MQNFSRKMQKRKGKLLDLGIHGTIILKSNFYVLLGKSNQGE
jgi:hypothetical protein